MSMQLWLVDGECLETKKTVKLAFLLVRAHRDACLHNHVFGFFDFQVPTPNTCCMSLHLLVSLSLVSCFRNGV